MPRANLQERSSLSARAASGAGSVQLAAMPMVASPAAAPDELAIRAWCKRALSANAGEPEFESEESLVAYRVHGPSDVAVSVCAGNDGSMKIADVLRFELPGRPPLELVSDVAEGLLLPRVELIEAIDSSQLLALGWWRSPPWGVSALLLDLPLEQARPVLHEQLRIEGTASWLLWDEREPRRIGVAVSDPNAEIVTTHQRYEPASLPKFTTPSARGFFRCASNESVASSSVIAFGSPGESCAPLPDEVSWFSIHDRQSSASAAAFSNRSRFDE